MLSLTLEPYQLIAFRARPDVAIVKAVTVPPEGEVIRTKARVQWLIDLRDRIEKKEIGERLKGKEADFLSRAANDAAAAMDKGWLWRARMLTENHLTGLFAKLNSYPPFFKDTGVPVAPETALSAGDIVGLSRGAVLVPSKALAEDWEGELLAVSDTSMTVPVKIGFDGRYAIALGFAAGGDYGGGEVRADGILAGAFSLRAKTAQGATALLPNTVSLKKGGASISIERRSGNKLAIHYLELKPVYDDITASHWVQTGGFTNGPKGAEARLALPYLPETERSREPADMLPGDSNTRWKPVEGNADYIDLSAGKINETGTISYARTSCYSPAARTVRFSYGMDYWLKIWINGAVIKDYEPHTGGAPVKGQFTVDVDIKEGWNDLLVKVASGSRGNGFWMAVSNPGDLRFSAQGGKGP